MKILVGILLAVVLFCFNYSVNIYSQENTVNTDTAQNSIIKGAWTIIFEVGTFIDTKAFEGFQFCGKYHMSNCSAVRLGASYVSNSSLGDIDYEIGGESVSFSNDNKNSNIKVFVDFLYYLNRKSPVVALIGGGPIYNYEYVKNNMTYYYGPQGDEAEHRENVSKVWGTGLHALLGAEWFITNRISLIGEYNASVTIGKSKTISTEKVVSVYYPGYSQTREINSNILKLSFNTLKLGASVYF